MYDSHKILFIVAESSYFISHRLPLALQAQREGYSVALASSSTKNFESDKLFLEAQGINVFQASFDRAGLNPFNDLKTVLSLYRIIKNYKPDIVHNVALKPILYGSFMGKICGVKKIINAIAGLGYVFTSKSTKAKCIRSLFLPLFKKCLKKTHVIVQNSEDEHLVEHWLSKKHDHQKSERTASDREDLSEESANDETVYDRDAHFYSKEKNHYDTNGTSKHLTNGYAPQWIHLIPGAGIDTEQFTPSPHLAHNHAITLVARMLWSKGIGEVIDAARMLKQSHPHAVIQLVGDPDEENPDHVPHTFLQKAHDEGIIKWLRTQKDIHAIYQHSQIAILPSYREGLPKSLLEAMACGLPIITTHAPGCSDLIQGNGLLSAPGNAKRLYENIVTLLDDYALCKGMGKKSRELALSLYALDVINMQIIHLYRNG